MSACGIVVAGGAGRRLGAGKNKALLPLHGRPLFLYALQTLRPVCEHLMLVVSEDDRAEFEAILRDYPGLADDVINGGQERRHSVENALKALPRGANLLLIHDAARPLCSPALAENVKRAAREHGAAMPMEPVYDTLRRQTNHGFELVPREELYRVQTPQGFLKDWLLRAYISNPEAMTDDAGLVEKLGLPIYLVPGEPRNFKITSREDFDMAEQLLSGSLRVGSGFDTHRLVAGRALILCGVTIPHDKGLLGHSDADVALHALTDALFGACALGDIGRHFPDTKEEYRGADSLELLRQSVRILREAGFAPHQCDVTLLCQAPKLAPHIPQMRENIARALGLHVDSVSVKATTTEGLGYEGRGEGISAQALATVRAL